MKLAAIVAALLLSAGVAHAQGPENPYPDAPRATDRGPRAKPLRRAVIEHFDLDRSGRLEPHERKQASRALRRMAKRLAANPQRRERLIRRFDRNGDGNLGPGELPPRMIKRLRKLDRNGDGWLGTKEL